jgi:uncharacterized membrane protein YgcG
VCPFIVLRGPQRICVAALARAGLEVMASQGTISAVIVVVGRGTKDVVFGRKERPGRRGVVRVVIVLERCVSVGEIGDRRRQGGCVPCGGFEGGGAQGAED